MELYIVKAKEKDTGNVEVITVCIASDEAEGFISTCNETYIGQTSSAIWYDILEINENSVVSKTMEYLLVNADKHEIEDTIKILIARLNDLSGESSRKYTLSRMTNKGRTKADLVIGV